MVRANPAKPSTLEMSGSRWGEPQYFLDRHHSSEMVAIRQAGLSRLTFPLLSPHGCLVGKPITELKTEPYIQRRGCEEISHWGRFVLAIERA